MSVDLPASWQSACIGLGVPASPIQLKQLLDAYAEPQRHYHTRQHLSECMDMQAATRQLAEHPAEVEMALWFHDAIYEVKAEAQARDNLLRVLGP
ncbi:MAG: hypothetical protein LBL59_09595 [Xanthomonadaceae bacterium]|jgi:predicted metal-dependent HD superfamily phosphohydrolase|nr:hypothetical protein [Xanthomonadaceae bacterium]